MNLKARFWFLSLVLASMLILSACGGGTTGGTSGGTTAAGGGAAAANLNLTTPGEQLAFQPAALTAKSGAAVKVTFKNGSAAQQHNFVLVKGDDSVAAKVDEAGTAAGPSTGYIPQDPNIIGSTKLLNGNETGTAEFTAPAPGTYTFLCTFPGHYAAGMKGTFTVN